MIAIIKTGGKQYLVEPGKKIKIEKIKGEEGKETVFDQVLLVTQDKDVRVGTPLIDGAKVRAKILSHFKGDKIIVFKYKPKKRQRIKKGHRQQYTEIEVTKIEA
ncbi:MAG: 50S ribosomal protein L21 [Minisyncoccales bacterium]|jgi:large subunit ribosomal protein L21